MCRIFIFIIIIVGISIQTVAQDTLDSNGKSNGQSKANGSKQDSVLKTSAHKPDSTAKNKTHKIDSIQKQFVHRTDGLQKAYTGSANKITSLIDKFNHPKAKSALDSSKRKKDSIPKTSAHKSDSTTKYKTHEADSTHKQFVHRTDSLPEGHTASPSKSRSSINRLNHKKDSLNAMTQKLLKKVNGNYQYKSKGKSVPDSSKHKQDSVPKTSAHKSDSITKYKTHEADSTHKQFVHRTDSLQKDYASSLNKIDSSIIKLNHKKDSLNKLHLPTQVVTHQIDSLQQAQTAKLKELNGKIDKVKKETLTKISALHLAPEAQKEVDNLAKNIHGFKVPNNFFKLPGMNFIPKTTAIPGLSNFSLKLPSNLSIPSVNIPSLQKFNLNTKQLPSLSQMKGSLGNEIKQLQSTASIKSIEQTVTKELSQNAEVKSLLKEETQVKDMAGQLSKMKDAKGAEALAKEQLKPAINHFAGKEKELQSAMGEISKYKQKYSSVKSLAELPKRAPNPLKEKPWIERVVPGLNYFILSKHSTFVDFNPYVGWRFNPKLTASIGWSERIGISHGNVSTSEYDRVYGVRANVSYLWTHGFIFRLSPELMSAYVPTSSTPDVKEQALVFGLFAGIRKDFKIYKGFIGYSEGMYNFTQKSGQNLYGDRLSLRLGFEVKIKKKVKKPEK